MEYKDRLYTELDHICNATRHELNPWLAEGSSSDAPRRNLLAENKDEALLPTAFFQLERNFLGAVGRLNSRQMSISPYKVSMQELRRNDRPRQPQPEGIFAPRTSATGRIELPNTHMTISEMSGGNTNYLPLASSQPTKSHHKYSEPIARLRYLGRKPGFDKDDIPVYGVNDILFGEGINGILDHQGSITFSTFSYRGEFNQEYTRGRYDVWDKYDNPYSIGRIFQDPGQIQAPSYYDADRTADASEAAGSSTKQGRWWRLKKGSGSEGTKRR